MFLRTTFTKKGWNLSNNVSKTAKTSSKSYILLGYMTKSLLKNSSEPYLSDLAKRKKT